MDSESIVSLLSDDSQADLSYASSMYEYIVDNNNSSYQQSVNFDLLSITGKWVDLHSGYLQIPLRVRPSAAAFSANPIVAFKGSALSLINGIQIKTGSGQIIVDERDSTRFSQHLALMLEESNDWFFSNKGQLHFSKDVGVDGVQSTLLTAANINIPRTNMFTAAVSASANSLNPLYNKGFAERQASLMDATQQADGTFVADKSAGFEVVLHIPLRYITSFFDQLTFPIINTRLMISVFLNLTASGTGYSPMCMGMKLDGATTETGTSCVTDISPGQTCRLYYKHVQFSKDEHDRVAKQLQSGFSKRVEYSVFDLNSVYTNIASTAGFQHTVSSNVVNPKRVWIFTPPTNYVNGVNWPSPIVTGSHGLTNINVKLNDTNYFTNQYTTLPELYRALKDQMPPTMAGSDTSSVLTYADFCKTYRIHCLDISRCDNRQRDANAPCSLAVTASPLSSTAIDVVYLVEKVMVCKLKFSTNEVQVEVGSNLV